MEELPGLYFMRARYYSADAGVFFSTDPVKNIGPGWKPMTYGYGSLNPFADIDPSGEISLRLDPRPYVGGFIYGFLKRSVFDICGVLLSQ